MKRRLQLDCPIHVKGSGEWEKVFGEGREGVKHCLPSGVCGRLGVGGEDGGVSTLINLTQSHSRGAQPLGTDKPQLHTHKGKEETLLLYTAGG